jgi:hypothetical protein
MKVIDLPGVRVSLQSINNNGEVSGAFYETNSGASTPFIWDGVNGTGVIDLSSIAEDRDGFVLDINDNNQVVGVVNDPIVNAIGYCLDSQIGPTFITDLVNEDVSQ